MTDNRSTVDEASLREDKAEGLPQEITRFIYSTAEMFYEYLVPTAHPRGAC